MTMAQRRGFVTMEAVVSLGIALTAFAAFLQLYQTVRGRHLRVQQFNVATFILQSQLEQFRLGQLPDALDAGQWTESADHAYVYPAQPSPTGKMYQWQIRTDHRPRTGELCALTATVAWEYRGQQRKVSATTEHRFP